MNITIRAPALSMQADAYFIKNPLETKNAFTVTSAKDAADVLRLKGEGLIGDLKELIRGYDFTSISSNELARIGLKLHEVELLDEHAMSFFTSGNMAFDKNGHQTQKDVKFNAIAMFNQMLGDNRALVREWPMYAQQESFRIVTKGLVGANKAINALFYFANSDGNDLSVSIRA